MEDSRISHQAMQWELIGYKRKPGRPSKNYRWTSSNEISRTWTLPGKRLKNWQKTEQEGVHV